MDQCEDREEGAPPSKTTLCGEHESQTKAQSSEKKSVPEQLLDMLDDFGEQELEHFHWYLQNVPVGDFPTIKKSRLEKASRTTTVDVMVQTYTEACVMEVATSVLKKMKKGKSSDQEASQEASSDVSV